MSERLGISRRQALISGGLAMAVPLLPAAQRARGARRAQTVFGLSPGDQGVYRYNGSGMSWTQVGGPASAIYGGGYGLVATNPSTGNLYRYRGTPNNWEQIGGPGAAFTVTSDTVFGLSPGNQGVYRYNGSGMSWTQVGGPASAIVAY